MISNGEIKKLKCFLEFNSHHINKFKDNASSKTEFKNDGWNGNGVG